MADPLTNLYKNTPSLFPSSESPSYTTVPTDAGTAQMIHDSANRGSESTSQIANEMNAGVNGNAFSGQDPSQRAAQTGEDPAMLAAIKNQYSQVAGKHINDIIQNNVNHAAIMKAQRLQSASNAAFAQQHVETQNYEALNQAYMDSQAARAQVLASVFGAGGAAGGVYMANRHKRSSNNNSSYNNAGEGAANMGDFHGMQGSSEEF